MNGNNGKLCCPKFYQWKICCVSVKRTTAHGFLCKFRRAKWNADGNVNGKSFACACLEVAVVQGWFGKPRIEKRQRKIRFKKFHPRALVTNDNTRKYQLKRNPFLFGKARKSRMFITAPNKSIWCGNFESPQRTRPQPLLFKFQFHRHHLASIVMNNIKL